MAERRRSLSSAPSQVGGWYLERTGAIAKVLAPIEARLATEAIALRLTVQSIQVEGLGSASSRAPFSTRWARTAVRRF